MSRPTLHVIIASTRPGRVGLPVARWFTALAAAHGGFDVEGVDLAEIDLPMADEPHHPRLRQYVHQHTKDWSATVDRADAFVFVMPEYNFGFNAALKNAIDHLHGEWQHKPLGFVSYGGVSAGTRAVQMIKQVVSPLKMVTIPESVSIPFVQQFLDGTGKIKPNETMQSAAKTMLDELLRFAEALRPLRENDAEAEGRDTDTTPAPTTEEPMDKQVVDNPDARRFEIYQDGDLAGFVEYHLHGDEIALLHTEIESRHEGQGLAGALARHALDDARQRSRAVLPYCRFIRDWIGRHAEYIDLVPESHRARFEL